MNPLEMDVADIPQNSENSKPAQDPADGRFVVLKNRLYNRARLLMRMDANMPPSNSEATQALMLAAKEAIEQMENEMEDVTEALEWALDELKGCAGSKEKSDSPFWNDFNRAEAIMKGKDPDNYPYPIEGP